MISIITKSSNRSGTEVYRLMVDSEADLLNIKFYCAPGSKAFTPDMGSMWVMGPNGKWT